MPSPIVLDCTFRDGGYYNAWDFPREQIERYLVAMKAAGVDIVELGFRFLKNDGFKGACAYTTDDFLRSLPIPRGLSVSVMVNGADLLTDRGVEESLAALFPETADTSPVEIVRFACHFREVEHVLPAVGWLAERGYKVGFNLMQISDRTEAEVRDLARRASDWPVAALYIADSMGSMTPEATAQAISWMRQEWDGPIGVHTHDNMGLALQNTLSAHASGATWLDATVTGMGRGPGNARTEELVIEAADLRGQRINMVPLLSLIRTDFGPMKERFGWGTNPFYYLSGKYGIHPTYIQEMLSDDRFDEEDVLAVIDHLREEGGKKFSFDTLVGARQFYRGTPRGTWAPREVMADREVLILGSGPGAAAHRDALEAYIRRARPLVMALNTQEPIAPDLIDLRVACHPVRMMADAETHAHRGQPLVTPASMLPANLREELGDKDLLDFGLGIEPDRFEFHPTHCVAPNALVLSYALAVATSGGAARILMAGFDGFPPGDARNDEVEDMLSAFDARTDAGGLCSVTPTRYKGLASRSIYAM